MNASTGRRQTTKGMWLSRCVRPSLLIMDVEGSDGRERGEDDTSFEKQSALFALTVSDLMMVNMWLRDIGREQGGSIPLLRTVFRERAKLESGRTKVLVIIRGYDNETPFRTLVDDVVTNMEELWKSVHDQPGRPRVLFHDYIEVSVVALPDKIQEQKFKREVAKLREWFATNSLVGFRQDKVSASGFSFSAKGIWESIRQNKRLNLPAHRVMVSSFFCEKVVKEIINSLESNEDYLSLKKGARSSSPKEFSEKLGSLLKSLLTHFDTETELYEAKERAAKHQELEDEVLHHVESICRDLLYELRLRASSESKDKITSLFGNADDPSAIVDQSVEDCLKSYIESCEDLSTRYKNLCDENCKVLKSELLSFAKIMAERIKDLRIRVEAEHARDDAEQKAQRAKEEAALAKEEADRESRRAKEETERLIEQARKEAERAKQEAADRARQDAELAARNRGLNDPLMSLAALVGTIGRAVLFGPAGLVGVGGILDPTMQNQNAPATGRGLQPPYPTATYGYEPPYPTASHGYGAPNPTTRPGYGPPYPTADHGYYAPAQSYPATSHGSEPAYPGMRGGYEPAKPAASRRNEPAKPTPAPRNPANLPGWQPAKPVPPPRNPANLPGSEPAKPTPPPRKK